MGQRILKDLRKYGIAAAAVLLLYFLMHAVFNAFCPLVVLTGFPCKVNVYKKVFGNNFSFFMRPPLIYIQSP